jgi:uncharacterized membrane protein YdbT with pleckstrin-like domain
MPQDLVIRPTTRRVRLGVVLAAVVGAAVVYLYFRYQDSLAWWFLFLVLIPFLVPLVAWIDNRRTVMVISGRTLTWEQGFLSKATRTMALEKVQDVRVERTLSQRMWGVGTIVLETAGEQSALVMPDVDKPLELARLILEASREGGEKENRTET